METGPSLRSLRVFLSHSYKSPAANLHFYNLFSRTAQVQFSVDRGDLDTNVTRLERLVRDADAFIGIYPLPVDPAVTPPLSELRKHARYFQLELDLAIRARIPAIVFMDSRYANVLSWPGSIRQYTFRAQEVQGGGQAPRDQVYAKAFESFCDAAVAFQSYRVNQLVAERDRTRVGLLLPDTDYGADLKSRIKATIEEHTGREAVAMAWPPVLGKDFYSAISEFDWMIVDVGDDSASAGVVGFLHGHFMPALRLVKADAGHADGGRVRASLYGGLEAGYPKDIVQWKSEDELQAQIEARIKAILLPQDLLDTPDKAISHFESTSLRKEVVFVSYSGKDVAQAAEIVAALKKVFKTVFDYKDGESIVPGRPWLDEIFRSLSRSAVAVPLLSSNYLQSGNCVHEAQQIVAFHDEGKLDYLPVRLNDERLDTPPWFGNIQHARLSGMKSPADIASMIVRMIDDRSRQPGPTT